MSDSTGGAPAPLMRRPTASDAKRRAKVLLADGTIGVLSYWPLEGSKSKGVTPRKPGRATVVIEKGRRVHPSPSQVIGVIE